MHLYRDLAIEQEFLQNGPRVHPWSTAEHDPHHRYVDFKRHPALIPETLIDFHPWQHHEGVQRFYDLVGWVNGPDSLIESNDCAFKGPHANPQHGQPSAFGSNYPMCASGRLMVLWRNQSLNLVDQHTEWLAGAIEHYARQIDPQWDAGVIGLAFAPSHYLSVSSEALGRQLSIQWWVWGEDEAAIFQALARLSDNLKDILKNVSTEVRDSEASEIAQTAGNGDLSAPEQDDH